MRITEILIIAIGLSMDAFAVSICTGLSMDKATPKKALIVGLYFGGFQALMPLIGYLLGARFAHLISAYDHWVAFVLLAIIGGKMIAESFQHARCPAEAASLSPKRMLPLALATSIDALVVGVTLAFLRAPIALAVSVIGVVTLCLSAAGLFIGNIFGLRFKRKAELAGGIALVLMGTKILLEHTGIL